MQLIQISLPERRGLCQHQSTSKHKFDLAINRWPLLDDFARAVPDGYFQQDNGTREQVSMDEKAQLSLDGICHCHRRTWRVQWHCSNSKQWLDSGDIFDFFFNDFIKMMKFKNKKQNYLSFRFTLFQS